jgi:hypothetical protein
MPNEEIETRYYNQRTGKEEMRWILGMGPVPRLVANKDGWDKVIGAEAGMGRVPDGNTW